MLRYKAGSRVGKGTYWDLSTGHRIDVAEESTLSGAATATYLRVAPGVMVLVGPIIGLLYVIALPFIGIATLAALAAGKAVNGLLGLVGRSLLFGWRPNEAYLSGKKKNKKEKK